MIIVASSNGDVSISEGMDLLKSGGTALDAVERACRIVEDNIVDHSVGTGGFPNLIGQVELDASIMDGAGRLAGAVAALKGYPHPISVARAVLENLPQHVLLVGEGAARFAQELGFEQAELLTDLTRKAFEARHIVAFGEEYSFERTAIDTPSGQLAKMIDLHRVVGTVNFLAIDSYGNLASAVSTSGWAFKYPGRAGDSPVIGAGNYCDNRYGACACTGFGEWSLRGLTARTMVLGMQLGWGMTDACSFAFEDLLSLPLPPPIVPIMNLVAVDPDGNHGGYSTLPGRTYIWQTDKMTTFETAERTVLPTPN